MLLYKSIGVSILSCIWKGIAILPTILLGKILDANVNGTSNGDLYKLFLLSIILAFFFGMLSNFFISYYTQYLIRSKSLQLAKKLLNLHVDVIEKLSVGYLIKSFDRGLAAYERMYIFILKNVVATLSEIIIVISYFFYTGIAHFSILVVVYILIYFVVSFLIIKWREPHINDLNESEDLVGDSIDNAINAHQLLSNDRTQKYSLEYLDISFKGYMKSAHRVGLSGALLEESQSLLSNALSLLAAMVSFGFFASYSEVSVGDAVTVVILLGVISLSVKNLTNGYRQYNQFLLDRQAINQVVTMKSGDSGQQLKSLSSIKIKIKDKKELCIKIDQGLKILIVGRSGIGKTALLKSITGSEAGLEIIKGVEINNKPASYYSFNSISNFVSTNYCETGFFKGRIVQAVFCGDEDRLSKAKHALNELGLADFLADERMIDPVEKNFSVGEARRLNLSRYITDNRAVAILDEPTNGLNSSLSNKVWDTVFSNLSGRTLICTSHDTKISDRFDMVIELPG